MRRAKKLAQPIPYWHTLRYRLYCGLGVFSGVFGAVSSATALSYIDPSGSIGLGGGNLQEVVTRLIGLALGLLGLIAVMMILWGGFQWMVSGGNEESVTKAKSTISSAIIGLIVILLAWTIVHFVVNTTANVSGGL